MASNEQIVTKLRQNKRAHVDALKDIGFTRLTYTAKASQFGKMIQWGAGLLGYTDAVKALPTVDERLAAVSNAGGILVACNRISDGGQLWLTTTEFASLTNEQRGKLLVSGITILANAQAFTLSMSNMDVRAWSGNADIQGLPNYNYIIGLWTDWNAQDYTGLIITQREGQVANGVTGAPAAESCRNWKAFTASGDGTPEDDNTIWSLPTVGHMMIMYRYKALINAAIIAVGFNDSKLQQSPYWTCCECDTSSAWKVDISSGRVYYEGKQTAVRVQPIRIETLY